MQESYEITVNRNSETIKLSVMERDAVSELQIPLPLLITDEDIDDILVSAFEGGINYWCNNVKIVGEPFGDCASEHVSKGGTVLIHDFEEDKDYELTKAAVIKGISQYLMRPTSGDVLEVIDHELRIDTCYIDADIADAMLQIALFDDIIYT